MRSALIGHTGFVGSDLLKETGFDDTYHYSNDEEIEGRSAVCLRSSAGDSVLNDADCLGLSLSELEAKIYALGYAVEDRFTSWKKLFAGSLGGIVRDYFDFLWHERRLGSPRLKVNTLAVASQSVESSKAPTPRISPQSILATSTTVTGNR